MDIFTGTSGFIFDCDGTLLDSMPAWNACEAEFQKRAGVVFSQEQLEEIRAASIVEAAEIFHTRWGIGTDTNDVLRIEDDFLLTMYQTSVELKAGVYDLLTVAEQKHIPCTVVTSSPRRYVEAGLRRCGIYDAFIEICTTDELHLSKQQVGIYTHAMQTMKSVPYTTWGFDDAVYALRVMKSIGIQTIGAYDCDETGTLKELTSVATYTVSSLQEIL